MHVIATRTYDKRFVTVQAKAALRAFELHRLAPSAYMLTCWRCGRGCIFRNLVEIERRIDSRMTRDAA